MFLDYIVNQRGIEANLDKIKALIEMQPPTSKKEVQRLTGRVATLNKFVSRATDICLPFFKVMRKTFEWNEECAKSSQELKKYLGSPSLLSRPVLGEKLYLYLVISESAVSSAFIRQDNRVHKPVYYTSKAFRGA